MAQLVYLGKTLHEIPSEELFNLLDTLVMVQSIDLAVTNTHPRSRCGFDTISAEYPTYAKTEQTSKKRVSKSLSLSLSLSLSPYTYTPSRPLSMHRGIPDSVNIRSNTRRIFNEIVMIP